MENKKITPGITRDKVKLHIQMVILTKGDSKMVSDTAMALTLIFKKEWKRQKTLTSVNGKKTKKMELESKFTQESAVIRDIGKMVYETAKGL